MLVDAFPPVAPRLTAGRLLVEKAVQAPGMGTAVHTILAHRCRRRGSPHTLAVGGSAVLMASRLHSVLEQIARDPPEQLRQHAERVRHIDALESLVMVAAPRPDINHR